MRLSGRPDRDVGGDRAAGADRTAGADWDAEAGVPASGVPDPALPGVVLTGVARRYGRTLAVSGVDIDIPLHRRVCVVGPSGCGKSTLLNVISGLEEPDEGTVRVLGTADPAGRLARCAWMPQRDLLLPWRDVVGNAALSLENRGVGRRQARERVLPLLRRFGLAGFEDLRPSQLSGGMRQRVSFLRTLLADKEVLLLDEPFGALDSITRADIQGWLRAALDATPRTVVMVTHDVEEALLLGHRVVVMSHRPGRVVAELDVDLPQVAHRREAIARPEFIALRETVLRALEG